MTSSSDDGEGGSVKLFVVGGEGGSGAELLDTAGDGGGVELLGNSVLDTSLFFLLLFLQESITK
jgi:hypothetical protein